MRPWNPALRLCFFGVVCWLQAAACRPAAPAVAAAPTSPTSGSSAGATASDPADPAAYPMVRIPAGTALLGCTAGQGTECYSDEPAAYSVEITRPFEIGRFEVTQALWAEIMGNNPANHRSCGPSCPVDQVNWYDVVAFANALSARHGLAPCYTIKGERVGWPSGLDCAGYRLPTEAEWEVAARAGLDTRFAGGDEVDRVAWYAGNSEGGPHPVGLRAPNALGLYDMSGNIREWTWDSYTNSLTVPPGSRLIDPTGPRSSTARALRGGSWHAQARELRVSTRSAHATEGYQGDGGARLARTAK